MANYPDKFALNVGDNQRYAQRGATWLVHTAARFEGVSTSWAQTQTIMDGLGVDGVPLADINVIVYLKRGWSFVTESDLPFDWQYVRTVNATVAADDSLAPGEFRTGAGLVALGDGNDFVPPLVDANAEIEYLHDLLASDDSTTYRALKFMYHVMRRQLFWDGNKRTALLAANRLMILGGTGLINVPLNHWARWNDLITAFYRSGDAADIIDWTYQYGIQGPEI
ncbi:Fic family protein [Lacticaseibacillus pantheris]|uniref:Fido domain-containing protein n=1 Tax=Lacticaseibacillus pantheris DSM 15945 = JCM 12539 = NBRC 106106 TaxID=1423783 RepID=A0A0R1U2C5_9LACO|nr:Fic family protein [Lacticaseibacillus pantheris]KRL85058.1 hypothetical protein FC50_GL001852 [Lacticaseibacillus pantheris DSM 15945 = JCM 12539 = NBRC 106106]